MTLTEKIKQLMEIKNQLQICVQHSRPNVRKKRLKHWRELPWFAGCRHKSVCLGVSVDSAGNPKTRRWCHMWLWSELAKCNPQEAHRWKTGLQSHREKKITHSKLKETTLKWSHTRNFKIWGNFSSYRLLTSPIGMELTHGSQLANIYRPLRICTKSLLVPETD